MRRRKNATTFDSPIFGRISRATINEISYPRCEPSKVVNFKFRPPITPPGGAECKKNNAKIFLSESYLYKYICRLLSCSSAVLTAKNCIQIMHFRSDEKFLKLTKILEIKNKGNFRGSVWVFRRPK
jgi:hypothetical protein